MHHGVQLQAELLHQIGHHGKLANQLHARQGDGLVPFGDLARFPLGFITRCGQKCQAFQFLRARVPFQQRRSKALQLRFQFLVVVGFEETDQGDLALACFRINKLIVEVTYNIVGSFLHAFRIEAGLP